MKKNPLNIKQPSKPKETVGQQALQAHQEKDYERAKELYFQLLKQNPQNASLLSSIGQLHIDIGEINIALEYIDKSLSIDNKQAHAHSRRGFCLQLKRDMASAEQEYLEALSIDPNNISALNNISSIYCEQMDFEQAEKYLLKLLELEPNHGNGLANLGTLRLEIGNVPEALSLISKALDSSPHLSAIHSNYVFDLMYEDHTEEEIFSAHKKWSESHSEKSKSSPMEFSVDYKKDKKLRIGYISPDFKQHSVSYFFVPILKSYNKDKFEVFCYQDSNETDDLTIHLKSMSDQWRKTADLSDRQLKKLIEDDKVDILIELAGHTAHNRMKMLSMRAAPIQVSYLGYPTTTGLNTIDYRITDAWADQETSDSKHTETLERLPNGFLCYQPPTNIEEPSSIPFDNNGYISFGSFNVLQKISDRTLEYWCAVLHQVPNSRIVLKARGLRHPKAQQRLLSRFSNLGIDEDRIELLPPTINMLDHIKMYNKIDIALDTFPYNGTTTTCEALWMGVPVVTLLGTSHHSRVGYSIMQQAGLIELVANDKDSYVKISSDLAKQPDLLRHLRTQLRPHLKASKLCDSDSMNRNLEEFYQRIWRTLCENKEDISSFRKTENDGYSTKTGNYYSSLKINFNDSKPQYLLNNKNKLTRDSVCLLEHSSWYPDDNDAINNILNNSSNFLDLDPGNGEFLIHSLKCHKHIQSFYTGNNNEPISTNLTINKIKVSRATHVDNVLFLKERIDFVKISSSENVRLLLSYISHNKSTIPNTIYLQRNGLITESIYNEFKEFGYDIYQHIPVSNAFSPSTLSQIEAENNNSVYLIHKNKVTNFVSTGFILSDSTGLHNNKDWRTDLSSISPPLSEYISEWISLEQNSEYITGLNYLISALDSNTSPADKYTQSLQAYKNIISGVKYEPNLPRLFTCCRAALELGLHNNALEIISIALEILINNKTIDINEPFVATNKEYDNIKPNGDLYQWCLASALSSYLTTLHPVYTDTSDKEIPLIQLMDSLPFHSDKMDLRIISMRNKTSTVSVEIKDIDKSTQTINNEIAAIYHLARTGGTLISKCIACIPGNFLLSEINPSFSVANPAEQAQSWFDIFSKNEFEELLKETNYENIITEIRNRVSKNGGKLIIRDWTHIDFTGIPFTTPSYQLKQKNSLGNLFNLHDIATVRHPIDSYLSLNNLKIVNGRISVKSYLEGANKFAIEAKNIGFIRYEDFCHSPDDILKRICKSLNIFYSDEYKTNFYKYERITGETTGGRSSDTIKVPKRPNIQPALEKEFKENPLYWDTLEILGYDS